MEISNSVGKRCSCGHDSLKVVNAVNFQSDGNSNTRCSWLRDDLEEVYALLFRFLGFGFRLAMSSVDWHVTQKFDILVPDPIGFAPWPVLPSLVDRARLQCRSGQRFGMWKV